jgi:hypothetical protein
MALMMCGAAPPEEGVQLESGVGSAHYQYTSGGCVGPTYNNKVREARVYNQVSYRSSKHIGVTGEATLSVGEVYSSTLRDSGDESNPPQTDNEELGHVRGAAIVAIRPSLHFKYGGLELGPGLDVYQTLRAPEAYRGLSMEEAEQMGLDVERLSLREVGLFPSGRFWAGYPKYAYAWLDLGAGPGSPAALPIGIGVGHASEKLRAELGIYGLDGALLLTGTRKLNDKIWLGGRAHVGPDFDAVGGMLMFGYDFGTPEEWSGDE